MKSLPIEKLLWSVQLGNFIKKILSLCYVQNIRFEIVVVYGYIGILLCVVICNVLVYLQKWNNKVGAKICIWMTVFDTNLEFTANILPELVL